MARRPKAKGICHYDNYNNRAMIPGAELATPTNANTAGPSRPVAPAGSGWSTASAGTSRPAAPVGNGWCAGSAGPSRPAVSTGSSSKTSAARPSRLATSPRNSWAATSAGPSRLATSPGNSWAATSAGPSRPITPPWSSPGSPASNQKPPRGCNNANHNSKTNNYGNMSAPLTPPSTPPPAIPLETQKPWDLGLGYPKPESGQQMLQFNWTPKWMTYYGKNHALEWKKEIEAYHRLTLPIPTPDMDDEMLKRVWAEYVKYGKEDLYRIRLENRYTVYTGRLIFSSPLPSLNDDMTTWSRANDETRITASGQLCPTFIAIMGREEIASLVLKNLNPSLRDISSLAQTCKAVASFTKGAVEVWDVVTRQYPIERFKKKTEDRMINGEKREIVLQEGGVRSKLLVITGTGLDTMQTTTPYRDAWNSFTVFADSVIEIPKSFRHLVLHRIPFLDERMLEIMFNSMPSLETVSIRSCLLLDFSKLGDIIGAVERHARTIERGDKTKQVYIKVDWSPYRFFGPPKADRQGSFLITYHKPTFDIPKAATAQLYRLLPRARKIGMDLTTDSSSFWHFFRQLPGPDPLWAAKVREALEMEQRHRNNPSVRDWVLDNLCAGVTGGIEAPEVIPKRRMWNDTGKLVTGRVDLNYWREYRSCSLCEYDMPECLFVRLQSKTGRSCWACHYAQFVRTVDIHSHGRFDYKHIIDLCFQGKNMANITFDTLTSLPAFDLALAAPIKADMDFRAYMKSGRRSWRVDWNPCKLDMNDRAASARRWAQKLNPLDGKPIDFRQGGPQWRHPCLDANPWNVSNREPLTSFQDFKRQVEFWFKQNQVIWQRVQVAKAAFENEYAIDDTLEDSLDDLPNDLLSPEIPHDLRVSLRETLKGTLKQNIFEVAFPTRPAKHIGHANYSGIYNTWKEIQALDWRMYSYLHSRCEDEIHSLSSPSKVIWNLDLFKLNYELENNQWNMGAYAEHYQW